MKNFYSHTNVWTDSILNASLSNGVLKSAQSSFVEALGADPVLSILSQYNKRWVIYDSGVYGAHFIHYLLINGIVPLAVCDADPDMVGEDLYGFIVMSLSEAGEKFGSSAAFLIADRDVLGIPIDSQRCKSLAEKLKKYGCETVIFLEKEDLDKHWTMHADLLTWPAHSIRAGARFCADKVGFNYVVTNGERHTTDQPDVYNDHVYILGNSVGFSYGADDANTIPSCLQRVLNANNFKSKVINRCAPAVAPYDILLQLRTLNLSSGDKVLMFLHVPFIEPSETYDAWNYCRFIIAAKKYCERFGAQSAVIFTAGLGELDFHTKREKHLIAWRKQKHQDLPDREVALEFRSNCLRYLLANGCTVLDLKKYFNYSHEECEVYLDYNHLLPRTNAVIAACLYEEFLKPLREQESADPSVVITESMQKLGALLRKQNANNLDFKKWLNEIPRPTDAVNMKIGAAVVNCNPFTNGHLYLLETAANQVDLLYIFVVEEDRSDFPFKDRIHLVREGIAHLGSKVAVCPSGEYIISSFSFKDYFVKDSITTAIDPSMDVLFFGAVIAAELGIVRRFVGEEPLCNVTRQYNETMLRLLPDLGVEVNVIPRKINHEGVPISASLVRNCLKKGDMNTIERIVPPTTYKYLKEMVSN